MEQQEGIKSLLKDVASREGKEINDDQINTVISQYNGDYQKLITDIGKRQGVTDDKLDKFQNLVNQKYKLTDWEEYNKQGEEKLSKAGRPTAYEGTMDNESGLAAAQDFMTSGVKDMAPEKPVDPYDGGQDIEAVKNAPRVVEYPGKLPKQIEEEKQIINSLESYIEQKKEELGKKKRSYAYSGPQMSFVTGGQAIDNSEIRALDQAQDLLKKAKRYNDNPKGFIDGFTSPLAKDILTAGLTDMTRNLNLANALNKENPTEEERLLIEAYKLFDKAQNSSDPDFWYQSGQTVAEAIPYIIQFALTRGGNVAARKAAEAGLKKVIKNNVVRKGIGYTTGAVAQAPLMPQMYSQLGQERIDGKDWGRAISSAWTKTAGETFGEGAGDVIQKGLFRIAGSKLGQKLFNRFRSNFTKVIGWNGPWEILEENITNVWNATLTDERSWSDFSSWHEQGLIVVNTVVLGTPFAAQNQIARRNARKDYQKATDVLISNHGTDIKNKIDQIYDQYNMGQTLTDFHSLADNMEADQRQASMKYLMNKIKIDGIANYLSNDNKSRINFIQQYYQSLNKLDNSGNADFIEAVKNIAQNATDQEQMSAQFKNVFEVFSKQIDMEHVLAAKEYLGNALTYYKIDEARRKQINEEISKFKDNQGNITTATIDGQKWSIRNAQDLGQENKAIFAKSPDGNVRAFMSHQIKEWETKSPEDIKDELIAEQDANDEEIVSQMEPKIVNEQKHEMPNGDKVTIAQLDNGQFKMNLNGEEQTFENAEAMNQWFQENQTQEEDKETEPEAEAEINLDEIDLNEYSPQEFSDILAKKGYTPEEINEELMIERENIEKEIEKLSKDKTTDRNKRIKNKEQLKQKFAQLNEIDAILNKTTSEQETQQNIPENDENNLSDQEKVSQTKMLSAENQDNENLEDQESFQKSQPEEIDGEQKSQELTIPEGLNPDQVTDWVLENSNDPVEIVAAHEQEQSNIPANALQPWEEDMLNRKVRRSDVAEKIGKDIVDEEFSRYWLNGKEGAALDQIAQELSDIHGVNISEQDIIDLMYKYPNGNARKTTEKQKALEDKFKQITGVTFNKRDEYFDKQENKGTSIPQEKLATILNDFWTEEGYDLDNLYKNLFGKERKAFQEKYGISDTQIASLKNMVKSSPDQLQSSWTEENPVPFRTTTPEEVLLSLNEGVDTKIEILDSVDDLPSSIRNHPNFPGRRFSGAYMASNNTAYFIKENIKDAGTAIDLWVHEVGAHAGLIKLLPNKQLRDQFFDHVWNEANNLAKNDPEIARIINHVKQSYGNNPSILGEEFLAYYAEKYVAQNGVPKAHQSFWESILSKFKEILEKTFNFDSSLTRSDLDHIVKTAILKNYERTNDQKGTSGEARYRAGRIVDGSQRDTERNGAEILSGRGVSEPASGEMGRGRVLSGMEETGQTEMGSRNGQGKAAQTSISARAKESLKYKSNTLTGLDKVASNLDIPVNVVHSSETESDKAVSFNPEDGSVQIIADKTRSVVATKKAFISEIISNEGLEGLFSGKEQKRFNRLKEDFKDIQKPLSDQTYVDKLTHLTRRAFGLTSKQLTQDDLKDIIKNEPKQDDIRFRVEETEQFKRWSRNAPILSDYRILGAKPETPQVFEVYHGTTHLFYEFDPSKTGNKEGQFGAVNYFTSEFDDADRNYAGEGPDLTNRIESYADQKEWEIEQEVEEIGFDAVKEKYNLPNNIDEDDYHEIAKHIGRKLLSGGEGRVMELFVRLDNPVVINGDNETWISPYNEEDIEDYMDDATDEIAEENDVSTEEAKEDYFYEIRDRAIELSGVENQVVEAAQRAAWKNGVDEQVVVYALPEEVYYEEISATKLHKALKSNEELSYQQGENGELISHQVIADIFKNLGYDGIVLAYAQQYFQNMEMDPNTSHIHLFPDEVGKIKLADGTNIEFDENNNDIRFRTDNFYSPTEQALSKIKQEKGTPEQFKAMLLKNGAKQAELDWMGWDDFASGKKSLTVGEIQDWIDRNKVQAMPVTPQMTEAMPMFKVAPPIDSKAFKEWFGDSKVVDENGEPLVVYHGTTKDFNIFDLSKQGKNTGDSFNTKVGFYFTQDETLADDFTKRNWTKPTTKNKKNASILPVYLSILNPQRISARQFVNGYFNNNTREKLINQGYDGVIIEPFTKEDKESWDNIFGENSGSKEFDYPQYVAFSPTQIKSATGNKGTYDPQNPDIRFKVAKRNDDKYKKSFFQPTKEIAYSAALASELFSDLGVRITIPSKSFSSLPVETQRTMMFRMIGAINDSKIRKFIISLIPVDVMNDLIGSEVSPDVLLNNPSMLIKSFAFNGSIPVSVGRFFDSLANSVASLGAEYSFSPSLGINLRRAKIENDSANRTNEVNSIWEAGIVTSDGTEISSLDLRRSSKEILPASVTSDTNLIGVSNGNTFSGTTVPGSNDFSRDKLNFFSTYDAINNRHSINFKGYFGKDTKNLYNKAIENGFDVFIGPNPESDKVYVVDQVDPDTGRFDEHKVILGTNNISEARKLYLAAYEPGWEGLGNITRTDKKGLKNWFSNGNTKEEFAETGIRFKSESADEEFRKFNESFKKLLKSGAVAQKIDQLKKEMDDKSLSDVTYEKIKQEIDTLKEGARLGKKETKEQIKAVQGMLVQYAKKNMPLDAAGRQDVGIILTSIKNAHTPYMLNKAMNRINELSRNITTKSLLSKFDKLLNRKHTKSQSGKPVGTINPDVLEVIEKIKNIRNMSYEQLEDYADELKDDNVEDIALLSIFGSLDERSPEAINDALTKLTQIVEEGKIWYKVEKEQRMSADQNLREQAIETITGGKGIPSGQDLRADQKEPKDSMSKSFLTKNQSLEWLLDWISSDKSEKTGYGWMQKYFGDKLNRSANDSNKGIRETIEMLNEKASKIFGKGKHSLAKILRENAKKVKKTGVTYQRNGERVEIPLSQNEAYKRWMEMQDDTLRPTFEKMGWDDISLSQLEDFITPEVMQWAQWQLYEFYPSYYDGVNEAYKNAYFTNLPHNPLYTPIKREVTTVGDKDDSMLRPTEIISSVANRSLKSRVKNTHHILLSDGDGILARHIAEMEHFKAWVETIRELRSVIGSRAVQDAIKKTSGNSVRTAINDRINSLARGGADRADVNHLLDRVRSNFVTSALGLNITLFPKQLVSVAAYMNDLSLTEMISGMTDFIKNPKRAIEIMNQSELIKNRYKKGWTHEIEAALKSSSPNLLAGSRSFMNQLRDILLIATKLGDRFGIFGGYPVYVKYAKEYKKNHPNATEKEVHDYAMNWFERIVGRSQQSSEIKDTSKLQEGSVGKLFTMFKNSQQQYFRYEMAAIRNLIKGRGNTAHNIKILVNTHIVLPVLFQAVTNLFTDDDEKTEGLRLLRAGILGSWNGLLIAGDIIESGLERAMGENWQFSFSPVFSTVDDLLAGTSKLHKYATEGETEDLQKAIDYLMQFTSSTMTGIPYEPVKRHYNKLSGKTDVENSVKRTNKELNDIIDKYKDGPKHESASSLKYKYSSIKSKATRLENEGDVKEAERLRKIVEDSKINMSESDFSVKEIKEEIDRLDYLSN